MIQRLELKNFTAFSELGVTFSPGINVIIGENGTGKTHVLKAVQALSFAGSLHQTNPEINRLATQKLCRLFHPTSTRLSTLCQDGNRAASSLSAEFASGLAVDLTFSRKTVAAKCRCTNGPPAVPGMLIPAKEVLTLTQAVVAGACEREVVSQIFDDSYLDLIDALLRPSPSELSARLEADPRLGEILSNLVSIIHGRFERKDSHFALTPGLFEFSTTPGRQQAGKRQINSSETPIVPKAHWRFVRKSSLEMPPSLTAEGFRKLGALELLLENGSLSPGVSGPLLWDEPEANLNPSLMKSVVNALLTMARNGQQVILATHDYVFLKWLDLLAAPHKGDHVRYFHLHREGTENAVRLHTMDAHSLVSRSSISQAFAEIYDADISRALE